MLLTAQQRRGIEVIDRDVCVLAGAGAGKTGMLVARYLHLIKRGLKPHQILALTFTERAAREMKERVGVDIENPPIGTIHAFCASILRRYAIEAGVDPAFDLLDEVEARRAQELSLRSLMERWMRDGDPRLEVLLSGLDLGPEPEGAIIGLYQRIRTAGDPIDGAVTLPIDRVKEGLDEAMSRLGNEEARHLFELPLKEGLALVRRLKLTRLPATRDKRKSLLKELRDEILPQVEGVLLEERAKEIRSALVGLLQALDDEYKGFKMARSLLDFSDLELMTRDLLSRDERIREEVRGRYEYILVDEFQDTNRLQKGILDLIRTPGRFFAVGDTRQSIYGFRSAEVEVFERFQREVEETGGVVVTLKDNFRSRPELIDFFNLLGGGLTPALSYPPKPLPSIELILIKRDDAASGRRAEAVLLAGRIKELVEKGDFRYGDFAILMRSTKEIKVYERALAEGQVPFYVVSGRGLFNTREVMDLMALLRVISNPRDEISLAAVLRSPFVGVGDEALIKLREHAPESLIDSLTTLPTGLKEREREVLTRFSHILEQTRRRVGRIPLWELILTCLKETGYLRRILLLPEGRRKFANLRKVVEFAREFSRGTSGFDLGDFLEVVRELHIREVREPEALLNTERDDVVKLMTVHAAKGLEFKAVAVVDLNRGRPANTSPLAFDPEVGIGFRLRGEEGAPLSLQEIRRRQYERERAEALRLFYVAVTRAKEHLILSASFGRQVQGEWLKHLIDSLKLDLDKPQAPPGISLKAI